MAAVVKAKVVDLKRRHLHLGIQKISHLLRWAQLIMQVRSGLLSAQEAARQLRISHKIYYKWERRALAAMVKTLGHREHGRPRLPADPEKETLERQTRELQAKLEVLEQTARICQVLEQPGKKRMRWLR